MQLGLVIETLQNGGSANLTYGFFSSADEKPGNALFDSRQIGRLAHIFCSSKSDEITTEFAGNTCRSLQTASLKNPSVRLSRTWAALSFIILQIWELSSTEPLVAVTFGSVPSISRGNYQKTARDVCSNVSSREEKLLLYYRCCFYSFYWVSKESFDTGDQVGFKMVMVWTAIVEIVSLLLLDSGLRAAPFLW